MRNLKKILALVLALVMSMSLLATANAFEDKDIDPTYDEAVTVLANLGVFEGYEDGSFKPKGSITRAETAAIIYRIVTGDVEGDDVKLYSDYKQFNDVKSTDWFAGYVNYCANAGYIMGRDGKTFDPQGKVTGYEALAMILRAVGYGKMGEFTGSQWQVNVASRAKSLGLTDNVIPGTLGTPATREIVAEVLFRSILVPTVEYTPAFGYQPTKTTLGGKAFELRYVEGVVTANEYADLDDGTALAEGKTRLENEDETYNLATTTKLTDLGETRVAYIAKGGKVLAMASKGNTVFETGAESDIANEKKFIKVTGLKGKDDAATYLNFGEDEGVYTSDYRIAYGDPADLKVIKAGAKISAADYEAIKAIFTADDDDEVGGHVVYVGTQRDEDISDKMSFKKFKAEYLNGDTSYVEVNETVNGDWLKVIDNNGDGVADYVFKTTFKMAQVVDLTKKGVLTLTDDKDNHEQDSTVKFGGKDDPSFVTSAELAEGDVVLYTVIDGVAFVELAPTFKGDVDKYTYKTETLTVDGTDYEASGIMEHTGYLWDLEDADKKTEYTYFQDFFGYIRAYALPAGATGSLVLLTDGYYENNRQGDEYAVNAFIEDKIVDTTVNGKHTADFINDGKNDKNGWGKLSAFGQYNANNYDGRYYDEKANTNLALYTMDEDGVMSLESAKTYAYGKKGQETGIKTDYIDLVDEDFVAGETDFAGIYKNITEDKDYDFDGGKNGKVTVQANKDTVYYYVSYANTDDGEPDVKVVTGYKNSLGVADEIVDIKAMYAVASNVRSDSKNENYWVADAIVIETEYPVYESSKDVVLGYNVLNKTVKDFGDLEAINSEAAKDELSVTLVNGAHKGETIDYNGFTQKDIATPLFYTNTETEEGDSYIHSITKNFAKYGIYVATVDREVELYDYIKADDEKSTKLFYDEDTVVYDLYQYNKKTVDVTTEDEDGDTLELTTGETYIVYAPDKDIVYAVLVDTELVNILTADGGIQMVVTDEILADLYNMIWKDANKTEAPSAYEVAVAKAEAALKSKVEAELKDALTALNALDTDKLTAEQKAYVNELKAKLEQEISVFSEAQKLRDEELAEMKGLIETHKNDWPEGAAEAAEKAAKEALDKMTTEELKALKPGYESTIWTDVIAPVVEAMQAVTYVSNADELVAALASVKDGDTIVLEQGTYVLSDALNVSKELTFKGEGAVELRAASGKNIFYMEVAAGKTVTLENLSLVANGTHAVQLVAHCAGEVVINNCEFAKTGSNGYGIYKNAAGELTVKNCQFTKLPVAIGSESAYKAMTITGNTFTGCEEVLGLTATALASGEVESVIENDMIANNTGVTADSVTVY